MKSLWQACGAATETLESFGINRIGSVHPGLHYATPLLFPPPTQEMMTALGQLETFLHGEVPLPILLKVGLDHAQFETIHPFFDGNGA